MMHILGSLGVIHALNLHEASVRMCSVLVAPIPEVSGPTHGPLSAISHIIAFGSCSDIERRESTRLHGVYELDVDFRGN